MEFIDAPKGYVSILDDEGSAHAIDLANANEEMAIHEIPTVCDSGIARDPRTVAMRVTCHRCISILA